MTAARATPAARAAGSGAGVPVRRSPIAGLAARLGANWLDETIHWASDYGDVSGEIAAALGGCVVADWGPIDKLAVKGPTGRRVLEDLGIGAPLGETLATKLDKVAIRSWALAPDETLLILAADASPSGTAAAVVTAAVEAAGATVTNLSSGLAGMRVVGPAARELLIEICAVDLDADRFADGSIAMAPMGNVRVTFARRDIGSMPAFDLLVARDQAAYLFEALLHVGAVHGAIVAGQRAIDALAGDALTGGARW